MSPSQPDPSSQPAPSPAGSSPAGPSPSDPSTPDPSGGAERCPCDRGDAEDRTYAACCGRYHGGTKAPTAVDVMRARYAAYVLGDDAYLLATWHPDTRPATIGHGPQWLDLTIADVDGGAMFDDEGQVRFAARHAVGDEVRVLMERSRFARVAGQWMYVDADDAAVVVEDG